MNKKKLLLIVFCILSPLFLILLSYKATLLFIDLTNPQQQTIDFLQDKQELRLNYTSTEVSHLVDVKGVIKKLDYWFYFLLLSLTLIITYYKRDQKQLRKLLLYGGITTVSLLAVLLLAVVLFFNTSFTFFHQIFFPQGNWTFPIGSLLIQTFPLGFFIKMARNVLLLTFGLGIVFILGYYFIFRGK